MTGLALRRQQSLQGACSRLVRSTHQLEKLSPSRWRRSGFVICRIRKTLAVGFTERQKVRALPRERARVPDNRRARSPGLDPNQRRST